MYVSPGEHNKLAIPEPIPVGTILECEYDYQYFTYTSYNGVNGWIIDIYMMTPNVSKVAYKSDRNIITTTDTILYKRPEEYASKLQTIPQNTELHVPYMFEYGNYCMEGYAMVTYNNESGWIKFEDCAIEINEVYDKSIEFSEDLLIDGKIIISKGEIVELHSKYVEASNFYGQDEWNNYYFVYNGYGFWKKDLGVHYPENLYVIFFRNYENLPINKKLKIKYYRSFLDNDSPLWLAKYYLEYNDKIYELKGFTGLILDESNYDIYKVTDDFNLTKTPYDNEVIESLSSGDIIYSCSYSKFNLDESIYYVTTEKGVSGYCNLVYYQQENNNTTLIASNVPKNELSNYLNVSKSNTVKFINNETSGDYSDYLKYNLSGDYITNKEIVLYIDFFGEEPMEKVIPIQSEINMLGTAAIVKDAESEILYYQISYDGQSGYAIIDDGYLTKIIDEPSGEAISSGEENINIYEIQKKKREASVLTMCILCICGAGILALTVGAILELVNKSFNKNSNLDDKNDNDNNNNNNE